MKRLYKIITAITFFVLAQAHGAQAQNMVPNSSFEVSGPGTPSFPPWLNAGNGTADYFATPGTAPANLFGYQLPHSGNAYAGAFIGRTGGATAENITATLSTPMITGRQYLVSMYVSLADKCKYGIDRIGVLFSTNMIMAPGGVTPHISAAPSVVNPNLNFITDTAGWTKLQWVYTANGNEQWINIGSFAPNGGNNFGSDTLAYPSGSWTSSYYYFDDICVLDLAGAPMTTNVLDTIICDFPATISHSSNGNGYLWSTGATTPSINISTPGTYWVKTFADCSFSIDTIVVKFGIPTQTRTVKDLSFCEGTQLLLSATQTGQNYEWNTASTGSNITVSQPGTYWVKYDLPDCRRHTDSFKVSYTNDPALLLPDTIICDQQNVYITTAPDYQSWQWSTGSSAKGLYIEEDGTYWVNVVTKSGCRLSDTFKLSFVDTRQQFTDTLICKDEPISFTLKTNAGPGASFEWQDGSTQNYFQITQAGTYSVKVTNGACTSENAMTVTAEYCDCNFKIPNAFSPNNDGKNDSFGAVLSADCQVSAYILRVFNRWGDLVFESYNGNEKWDGTFKGQPVEIGVYYYYIQFQKGSRNNSVKAKGDLTLLR